MTQNFVFQYKRNKATWSQDQLTYILTSANDNWNDRNIFDIICVNLDIIFRTMYIHENYNQTF